MSFATRYQPKAHRPPVIPEDEVVARVLTSILTIKVMPERQWQAVRSNWPREFDFHAEAIRLAMTPGVPAVSKEIAKAIKRLRAIDFDDINLDGKTISNMPEVHRDLPEAEAVSDCLIAGVWFAKLALIAENVDQFEQRVEDYRRGKARSAQVDDQRFLGWYAQGFSLKRIGQRLSLDEHQAERRFNEIARNLWRIANRTARFPRRSAKDGGGSREACAIASGGRA